MLVFLLGVFIYYKCRVFRERVNEEITRIYQQHGVPPKALPQEFLFRWKLIATFHDVGYLFEVAPEDPDKAVRAQQKATLLDRSLAAIESYRTGFFERYLADFGVPGDLAAQSAATLKGMVAEYPWPVHAIEDLYPLERATRYADSFALISAFVDAKRVDASLVQNYFDLCRKTDPSDKRERFLDHGVMSALILIKTADIQRYYLTKLGELALGGYLKDQPQLLRVLPDSRTRERLTCDEFYLRFAHVAGPIALHNIYPHLYPEDVCRNHGLANAFYGDKATQFAISPEASPLAYLTMLVDVLQDWDRHSFRRPRVGWHKDEPLAGGEVRIEVTDEKVCVVPLSEAAAVRYKRHLEQDLDATLIDWRTYVELRDAARYLDAAPG